MSIIKKGGGVVTKNLPNTRNVESSKNKEIAGQARNDEGEIAKAFAESEFEKYRVIEDRTYKSDFDKLIESTANN